MRKIGFRYRFTKEQYEKAFALDTEGYNMKTISNKLNIPYDTIRGWLRRGNKPIAAWTNEDWQRKFSNNMKKRMNWSDERRQEFIEKCRISKLGEDNPMWVGDNAMDDDTPRSRIRRKYKSVIDLLNEISEARWDIHHIYGNPFNNDPDNLAITTRKGHMQIDGRLEQVREMMIKMNSEKGGDLKRS